MSDKGLHISMLVHRTNRALLPAGRAMRGDGRDAAVEGREFAGVIPMNQPVSIFNQSKQ